MKLIIKSYNSLCALSEFKINGIEADEKDFGKHEDINPNIAEDYGCGNMKFIPIPATVGVLKKYGIDSKEYENVCKALDKHLSFGNCNWCS